MILLEQSYHIGKNYIRSIEIARKNIDITNQTARQFTIDDLEFDIIYAMDKNNYNQSYSLAKSNEDRKKLN